MSHFLGQIILLSTTWVLTSCGGGNFVANDTIGSPEQSKSEAHAKAEKPKQKSSHSGGLPEGVYGGHFDVDTFDGNNNKLEHIHEFDDKYQTNGIVFLGSLNFPEKKSGLSLQSFLDDNGLADSVFRLKLINTNLNKSAALVVNGDRFAGGAQPDSNRLYSLSSKNPNATQLTHLSLTVDERAILDGVFSSSTPSCVQKNKLGPNKEKRNGAFTLEILDEAGQLIWEISIYQHGNGCI